MPCFSTYSAAAILDHIFSQGRPAMVFTPPASMYLAVFNADAGLADNDSELWQEVDEAGYARVLLDGSGNYFDSATGFTTALHADAEWPVAVAAWNGCTHVAVMDAATDGNVLLWGALDATVNVALGEILSIMADGLDVTMAGTPLSSYLAAKALDHLLANGRAQTYAPLATIHVGLFTSDAGLAANNSGLWTEVGGVDYARQAMNGTDVYMEPAVEGTSGMESILSGNIRWPLVLSDWDTVTHFAFMDAETDGNVLAWGEVNPPKAYNINNRAMLMDGKLVVRLG